MIRTGTRRPIQFFGGDGYAPKQIGSYVATRDLPWNTIGVALEDSAGTGSTVDHLMTATEALDLAGINHHVEKWAVKDPDGNVIPKVAVTGYDHPDAGRIYFSAVTDKYHVVQPADSLAFFDLVVHEHAGAHYSAVWDMREKSMMGVTIEFPESIVIDPQGAADTIGLHGLGINSFDGSSGLGFYIAATRWFCMNQLATTIKGAQRSVTFKHTSGVNRRVQDAREALGITIAYAEAFDAEATRLFEQEMTDRQFENLVKKLDGPNGFALDGSETDLQKRRITDRREGVMANWRAEHNANITGTRWGAFNVLSEYAEWGRKVNGSPRTGTTPQRQRAIGTLVNWPTAFRHKVYTALAA